MRTLDRLKVLLMLGVAATLLLWLGLASLSALVGQLNSAWAMRHWIPVFAEVRELSILETRDPEGYPMEAPKVRYRYVWQGVSYEAGQVDPPGSDGEIEMRWYGYLEQAKEGRVQLLAFVDSAQPRKAVLKRGIGWPTTTWPLSGALLGLFCGALSALAFGVNLARIGREDLHGEPILVGGFRAVVLGWCVLTWPLAFLVWCDPAPEMSRFVISALALIGLVLAFTAKPAKSDASPIKPA